MYEVTNFHSCLVCERCRPEQGATTSHSHQPPATGEPAPTPCPGRSHRYAIPLHSNQLSMHCKGHGIKQPQSFRKREVKEGFKIPTRWSEREKGARRRISGLISIDCVSYQLSTSKKHTGIKSSCCSPVRSMCPLSFVVLKRVRPELSRPTGVQC